MIRRPTQHRRGFTLIELLVVVAIIAVLIGLLLPAVQSVRESASRTKCTNNLHQIGVALHLYHTTNGHFPPGFYTPPNMLAYTGWQGQLLPYLEQMVMFEESNTYFTANPEAAFTNANPVANFDCETFVCPTNTRPKTMNDGGVNYEVTSYMGCTGTLSNSSMPDGTLFYNSAVRITQITDGTSNTIAVGERPCTGDLIFGWGFSMAGWGLGDGDTVLGSSDAYMAALFNDAVTNIGLQKPTNTADPARIDGAHYWSFHDNGANFLFCDGSIHFLPYSANDVFVPLCTIAGGEVVDLPF